MIAKRLGLIFLGVCLPLAATTHCSSSRQDLSSVSGAGGGSSTTAGDVTLPLGGGAGEGNSNGSLLDPLCGGFVGRDCNPDELLDPDDQLNRESCRPEDVPQGNGGSSAQSGTSAGTGGVGGTAIQSNGGQAGMSQGGMAGAQSEAGGAAGEAGANGTGGIPTDAGPDVSIVSDADPLEPVGVACRVTAGEDGPVRACGLAGAGKGGAPCTSAADCAQGYACISEGDAGVCQRYCCTGAERAGCAPGDYCAPRTLVEADLKVPVCVRADNCSLSEPNPCPEGEDCRCAEGTACLVVRGDGTTTCIEPGTGAAGGACPCAWGHVCSQASHTCLKLCETVSSDQCGDGVCQASATLPDAWGVCIATTQ